MRYLCLLPSSMGLDRVSEVAPAANGRTEWSGSPTGKLHAGIRGTYLTKCCLTARLVLPQSRGWARFVWVQRILVAWRPAVVWAILITGGGATVHLSGKNCPEFCWSR
jgi:hypothetical protein